MNLTPGEVKKVLLCIIITLIILVTAILNTCKKCIGECTFQSSTVTESLAVIENFDGHKVCLIVPFRDRYEELLEFAPHIKAFLDNQHVAHEIWVLNQADGFRFNRASLINAGYKESSRDCDYIAMHDVDLLPVNSRLRYDYPEDGALHLSAPGLHPKYDYETFIGGIFLITRKIFKAVDGMSNKYWGWGLEDDEFFVRLRQANVKIGRPGRIGTGKSNTFKHVHNSRERKRDNMKCYNQRNLTRRRDRQTGLSTLEYRISQKKNLSIDGATVKFLDVHLNCDMNLTPWCNCTGAPPDKEPLDKTRDDDVIVPVIKRSKSKSK